ncbi:Isopentenyl-diphosphate Delta-isomerase 1 [Thelohanellus kitauei]|uniref:isopentenyl-diphosphate Delta-isomerase n=1 Tax=Thelohanellus kitauei TaxID=669202 RepID=A0A0C2M9L4_THEKT|nr:Isopentenyl-diphosphate Delta-isomerase 1 [Thelohanellus kitauei]
MMEETYLNCQKVQNRDLVPLVDINDRIIGYKGKIEAHTLNHLRKYHLHRAFSVFLFDTSNKLLVQRRSKYKITFPLQVANTCCSHPKCELDELEEGVGIKKAAVRRMEFELGIKKVDVKDLKIVSRLMYSSQSDDKFGENEIDYCIIGRKDVEIDPNPGEVEETRYISFTELPALVSMDDLTPWFRYICQGLLPQWWQNLDSIFERPDDPLPEIINAGYL